MKKVNILFTLLCLFVSVNLFAQDADADKVLGIWMNGEGTARIQIYKTASGKYNGRIVWLKEPKNPDTGADKLDTKNPDASKRSQKVYGLVNLVGFEYKGNKKWEGGTIYDPKNGNTYNSSMELKDNNTLNVRGSIPVVNIGRTDKWTRQVKKG
ncbi:hypothetical protein AD998_16800 [bacterium 336/3]|jgi:uncharacterized protein (DUF2147 family)|nr:hypothetical protein AD998_16800 [bacterium 336/3]